MNWMSLFQAVEAAAITVGAFYLNYLVREQKAAKDATLETKNAVIEHLKALSAPARARDLQDLTRYTDEQAAKNRDLQVRNRELANRASEISDLSYRLGFVQGLGEGRAALRLVFGTVIEELSGHEAQGLPPSSWMTFGVISTTWLCSTKRYSTGRSPNRRLVPEPTNRTSASGRRHHRRKRPSDLRAFTVRLPHLINS